MERIHYSFRDENGELRHQEVAISEAGHLIGYLLSQLSSYRSWIKGAPVTEDSMTTPSESDYDR